MFVYLPAKRESFGVQACRASAGSRMWISISAGFFRAIWQRRVRVLLATVGAGAVAFGAAKMVAPDYEGETRVLIESREPEFSGANQVSQNGSDRMFDESGILSQVQVLRSADLIKQVARNMKLHELDEFDPPHGLPPRPISW